MAVHVDAINTGAVDWYWGAWYQLTGDSLPVFRCTNTGSTAIQFNTFSFWAATAKSNIGTDNRGFTGNPITLSVSSTRHSKSTTVTITTQGLPFMQASGGSWSDVNDFNYTTNGVRYTNVGAQYITATFDSVVTLNSGAYVDINFAYTPNLSLAVQWYPTDIGMGLTIVDAHTVWSYHSDTNRWVKDKDVYVYSNGTWIKQRTPHKLTNGSWS